MQIRYVFFAKRYTLLTDLRPMAKRYEQVCMSNHCNSHFAYIMHKHYLLHHLHILPRWQRIAPVTQFNTGYTCEDTKCLAAQRHNDSYTVPCQVGAMVNTLGTVIRSILFFFTCHF